MFLISLRRYIRFAMVKKGVSVSHLSMICAFLNIVASSSSLRLSFDDVRV